MAFDFREIIPNNREPVLYPESFEVVHSSLIFEKEIAQTLASRFFMFGVKKQIVEKDYSNHDFSKGFDIKDTHDIIMGKPVLKSLIERLLKINGILQVRISCFMIIAEICEHFIVDKETKKETIHNVSEVISEYLETVI